MFRMAARNIKDNTSESVSEEQIKSVLRRSLDEVFLLFFTQGLCQRRMLRGQFSILYMESVTVKTTISPTVNMVLLNQTDFSNKTLIHLHFDIFISSLFSKCCFDINSHLGIASDMPIDHKSLIS